MEYYIIHLPKDEDSKIVYLAHLSCCGFMDGYTWTSNKNRAQHFSLEEALQIKTDFCAFKDSRENLVIACADGIKGRWDNED